ncbi:MAG TPA: helix-turn-helix transcriptional regulator [Gemmatimonadaceae bacterium]|nr:helix-turn-helix transcriptional regulator [Gemmatimonadaceae bacterium]
MSTIHQPRDRVVPRLTTGVRNASEHGAREAAGSFDAAGPRLSDLGKRIEMLRVDRGVSKQVLARAAGTSRQQLWRVMTGKSELTSTLCQRLASVLDVDSRTLSSAALAGASRAPSAVRLSPARLNLDLAPARSLAAYLESPAALMRTLRTLPAADDGVALKCAMLNALEDRARAARLQIPAWLFRVRASVLDGTL